MKRGKVHINYTDADNTAAARISLSGEITVNHISEVKSKLITAMQKSLSLRVVLKDITGLDLAGIQLLISLRDTSRVEQKPIAFDITLPSHIDALITKTGLMHNLVEKKN